MQPVKVHKRRTVKIEVSFGFDVSNDTFTSEIRVGKDPDSELIGSWDISFATDGTDGELVLTLDDSVTSTIAKTKGYMDIKRVTNGEPVAVFDDPLEVIFVDTITA